MLSSLTPSHPYSLFCPLPTVSQLVGDLFLEPRRLKSGAMGWRGVLSVSRAGLSLLETSPAGRAVVAVRDLSLGPKVSFFSIPPRPGL